MRLIDADALLKALNDYGLSYRADINGMIMQAPTIEPSGDLISRADAIEAVAKLQKYDLDERNRLRIYAPWHKPKRIFVETEAIYKCIYTMPSADAVGEKEDDKFNTCNNHSNNADADYKPHIRGEWEHWGSPFSDENEVIDTIVCSVCGARFIEPKDEPKGEYNFCPNCGAKMKGGAE